MSSEWTDTVWLTDPSLPFRIGVRTGWVIAFDPVCELILVEWSDGTWESHELRIFSSEFVQTVHTAVEAVLR